MVRSLSLQEEGRGMEGRGGKVRRKKGVGKGREGRAWGREGRGLSTELVYEQWSSKLLYQTSEHGGLKQDGDNFVGEEWPNWRIIWADN